MTRSTPTETDFRQLFDALISFNVLILAQLKYNDDLDKLKNIYTRLKKEIFMHYGLDKELANDTLEELQKLNRRGIITLKNHKDWHISNCRTMHSNYKFNPKPLKKIHQQKFDFIFDISNFTLSKNIDTLKWMNTKQRIIFISESMKNDIFKDDDLIFNINLDYLSSILVECFESNVSHTVSPMQLRSALVKYFTIIEKIERKDRINNLTSKFSTDCLNLNIKIIGKIPWWVSLDLFMSPLKVLILYSKLLQEDELEKSKIFQSTLVYRIVMRRAYPLISHNRPKNNVNKVEILNKKEQCTITTHLNYNFNVDSMDEETFNREFDKISNEMRSIILLKRFNSRESYMPNLICRQDEIKSYICALYCLYTEFFSKDKSTYAYSKKPNMGFDFSYNLLSKELEKMGIEYEDGYEQVRKKKTKINNAIKKIISFYDPKIH